MLAVGFASYAVFCYAIVSATAIVRCYANALLCYASAMLMLY